MEKTILLSCDGNFVIIIHACPNAVGKFQWYLVDDPNSEKESNIDDQIYESITISSNSICNEYRDKWLCCQCEVSDDKYAEGCVYLTNNFIEMIKTNQFDEIAFFDKDGNIRNDVSYHRKQTKI